LVKVSGIRQWGLAASLLLAFSIAGVQASEEIEALIDAPPAAVPRPNIVFILADDLGYTDIAPYGSEVNTPTLSPFSACCPAISVTSARMAYCRCLLAIHR
jgi:hypothetical protein